MAQKEKGWTVFTSDPAVRQMLQVLCEAVHEEIAAADADDAKMLQSAVQHAQNRGIPLILFGSRPPETEPEGIRSRFLLRPFRFTDFREAAGQLCREESEPHSGAGTQSLLRWDAKHRILHCGAEELLLTPREAEVFDVLYAASPEPVDRRCLSEKFCRTEGNGIDVYISYLRRKLKRLPLPMMITSVRGRGYALLVQTHPGKNV